MRIISPFYDYYDGLQNGFMDASIIFDRQPNILQPNEHPLPRAGQVYNIIHDGNGFVHGALYTIAFCGRLYRMMRLEYRITRKSESLKTVTEWYVDRQACIEKMDYLRDRIKGGRRRNREAVERYPHFLGRQKDFERMLDFQGEAHPDIDAWMKDQGIAIATNYAIAYPLSRDDVVGACRAIGHRDAESMIAIRNPRLADMHFYHLMDSYTAYQELSMWVGGVLPNRESDTVAVSDDELAQSKGFDAWSFRKLPTKRTG